MFIHSWEREREREREHEWGRSWERGRHRIQSRLHALSCQHRAWCRAWTQTRQQNHDLSWSGMLNQLSHPGTPERVYFKSSGEGRLDGSVGWVSNFGSDHDLTVHEFEPRVGLCAVILEPGTCLSFCVFLSLSLCPLPLMLSLSQK